jgi:membrane protease YdiL (CAAX protease family)
MVMRPTLRALELLVLFVGVPLALRFEHFGVPKLLVLAVFTGGCFVALRLDASFDRRELGGYSRLRAELPGIALRAAGAALVVVAVVVYRHGMLFDFPRTRPLLWLAVFFLYPFVSAWPQELIYRSFFFHRYGALLGRWGTVAASGVAFGLLHLVYADPITVALTVPAGLVLAHRYHRTRSLAVVWAEHALYGTAVFTLGLGRAFFQAA